MRAAPLLAAIMFLVFVQLAGVKAQILENDRRISARASELGRGLMGVPDVGPVLASALVTSIADPAIFKFGRDLASRLCSLVVSSQLAPTIRVGSDQR